MCRATAESWTRRQFSAGLAAAGVVGGLGWGGGVALAQTKMTGEAALSELMAGNERFVAGKITSFPEDLKILKEKTVTKQEPFAAVLSCADSRVPVELIFDQSIGHIFVVRVAGNIVTPEIIASIEYGVAVLGIRLILVMGHANCGAVKAALSAKEVPGQISVLYSHLQPAVEQAGQNLEMATKANVGIQAARLRRSSTVVSGLLKEKKLKVIAAYYDLGSGGVTLLE